MITKKMLMREKAALRDELWQLIGTILDKSRNWKVCADCKCVFEDEVVGCFVSSPLGCLNLYNQAFMVRGRCLCPACQKKDDAHKDELRIERERQTVIETERQKRRMDRLQEEARKVVDAEEAL